MWNAAPMPVPWIAPSVMSAGVIPGGQLARMLGLVGSLKAPASAAGARERKRMATSFCGMPMAGSNGP